MEKAAIRARLEELERAHREQAERLRQLEQAVQETTRTVISIEGMIAESRFWLEAEGEEVTA